MLFAIEKKCRFGGGDFMRLGFFLVEYFLWLGKFPGGIFQGQIFWRAGGGENVWYDLKNGEKLNTKNKNKFK